uniref:Gamma-secretase-activating protein C-terminal domain-containing protein n=1 Tax=Varanus komodoensis TaxID=61221 RepID=A0A8D2LWC7_VARKO
TLHVGLGVRCLPLHTLLHYIDHGVLRLTEKYVIMLLKGKMDFTWKALTFSFVEQAIGRKVCQMCNHPASSNTVARNYVKLLLEKHRNKQHRMLVVDKLSTRIEFLPLNYLVNMLVEAECQGNSIPELFCLVLLVDLKADLILL